MSNLNLHLVIPHEGSELERAYDKETSIEEVLEELHASGILRFGRQSYQVEKDGRRLEFLEALADLEIDNGDVLHVILLPHELWRHGITSSPPPPDTYFMLIQDGLLKGGCLAVLGHMVRSLAMYYSGRKIRVKQGEREIEISGIASNRKIKRLLEELDKHFDDAGEEIEIEGRKMRPPSRKVD